MVKYFNGKRVEITCIIMNFNLHRVKVFTAYKENYNNQKKTLVPGIELVPLSNWLLYYSTAGPSMDLTAYNYKAVKTESEILSKK